MWGGTERKDSIESVKASIDSGVTTIDTAPFYGYGFSEAMSLIRYQRKKNKKENKRVESRRQIQPFLVCIYLMLLLDKSLLKTPIFLPPYFYQCPYSINCKSNWAQLQSIIHSYFLKLSSKIIFDHH